MGGMVWGFLEWEAPAAAFGPGIAAHVLPLQLLLLGGHGAWTMELARADRKRNHSNTPTNSQGGLTARLFLHEVAHSTEAQSLERKEASRPAQRPPPPRRREIRRYSTLNS